MLNFKGYNTKIGIVTLSCLSLMSKDHYWLNFNYAIWAQFRLELNVQQSSGIHMPTGI